MIAKAEIVERVRFKDLWQIDWDSVRVISAKEGKGYITIGKKQSESAGSVSCEAHRPIEELKKEFSENFTDWYPCAEKDNCWWKLISKDTDDEPRYITPDMVWGWIEKKLSVR